MPLSFATLLSYLKLHNEIIYQKNDSLSMNNLVRIYHFGDDTEIVLIKKKKISSIFKEKYISKSKLKQYLDILFDCFGFSD